MTSLQQKAFEYFVGMGWSPAQSAGIVANLHAESGLRPDAVGDGGQAYGIAQWHPDRQANFQAIIGRDIRGSSLDDQLAFVHAELQRFEKRAGDALAACTTASEAGACVSMRYERPADTEGEANKRARLAETLLASYAGAAIPAAPIPTPPGAAPRAPAPDFKPSPQPESAMPAILAQLLPMVLGMFSQGAQAQLQPITSRPADQIAPFLLSLFSQIAGSTGVVPAGQPIKTDAEAVAAVAELAKQKAINADLVAGIERHALSYLADMAPLFDRIVAADKTENEARIVGANAAMVRQQSADPAMVRLVVSNVQGQSWMVLGGLVVALIAAAVAKGIWPDMPDYFTVVLALAGPLFGQVMKERGAIIAYYFDGTPASNASAALNQQIAIASKRGQ